jgi:tetratricopeptide (TPR) repeat protein
MELLPAIEPNPLSHGDQPIDQRSAGPFERLLGLCSWMMVLGTVRLICMMADYVGAIAEAIRAEPLTMRMLSRVSDEIHPIVAVSAAWPLILAIVLRRTRWPQLLPAAAATFLVLSIGGMIELSAQWGNARGYGGMVGSFHLNRRAFLSPTMSDLALGTLGAIQLLLELSVAVRAILLIPAFRSTPAENVTRQERARRARHGRIALYTSLGFLFVVIRLPVWSTYLELLNNSTLVRNFILENDTQRSNWRRIHASRTPRLTPEEKRFNDFRFLITLADQDAHNGRYAEARDRYQEVIAAIDSMPVDSLPVGGKPFWALALNNFAWLQATCPEIELRNSREAVKNARRATTIQPDEGNYWNTLGVAQYRAGDWDLARDSLTRSTKLRNASPSFDWFFLALVDHKLGNPEGAREWYDKAVVWFHQSSPNDPELYRFQVEAATELGLTLPEAPEVLSKDAEITPSRMPGSMRRLLRRREAEGSVKNPRR